MPEPKARQHWILLHYYLTSNESTRSEILMVWICKMMVQHWRQNFY